MPIKKTAKNDGAEACSSEYDPSYEKATEGLVFFSDIFSMDTHAAYYIIGLISIYPNSLVHTKSSDETHSLYVEVEH